MKCPACPDTTLVMTERQGVEIDYCPTCRGIWLDRGELDKLLERAATASPAVAAPAPHDTRAGAPRRPDFDDSDFHHPPHDPRRRRKSWLHDLFD